MSRQLIISALAVSTNTDFDSLTASEALQQALGPVLSPLELTLANSHAVRVETELVGTPLKGDAHPEGTFVVSARVKASDSAPSRQALKDALESALPTVLESVHIRLTNPPSVTVESDLVGMSLGGHRAAKPLGSEISLSFAGAVRPS